MKYYEILFTITPCTQDARDVLSALAGEAACETFEDTDTGLKAYVQQSLFDEDALALALEGFPFKDTRITYTISEAEDRDWNEQWEQEGFEPIVIEGEKVRKGEGEIFDSIVIHDGRHLPEELTSSPSHLLIEIDAHMAFGTGTHETTRMICATLLDMDLQGADVLDCGCGTGILGICALKLGARHCVGYDIDEWSADNTRHNAVINHVDQQMDALCGDATLLDGISQRFQVVMANINRNILLNDMERFRSVMADGATLILSGFYENDCALLIGKAQTLGLSHCQTRVDGDWACLVLRATT